LRYNIESKGFPIPGHELNIGGCSAGDLEAQIRDKLNTARTLFNFDAVRIRKNWNAIPCSMVIWFSELELRPHVNTILQ
jgi:hypothetical protein